MNTKKNQQGITLIMVLIFIVTLSLIAAVGMRSVIVGDRVVANERDRALAFQAAESTAREAATLIAAGDTSKYKAIAVLPLGGNTEHWRTTSGLTTASSCRIPLADVSTKRFDWTKDQSADVDCSVKSADSDKFGNAEEPRYVIELLSTVTLAGGAKAECWYRITSRATGGTKEADVILQAMFSKEIPLPGLCS